MAGEIPFDPEAAELRTEQGEPEHETEGASTLYEEFLQGKSDVTPMELITIFHAVPDNVLSEERTEYYWRRIIDLDLPIREVAKELSDLISATPNSLEGPSQEMLRSYIDEEVDDLTNLIEIIQEAEENGTIDQESGGGLVDRIYATYADASSLADELRDEIRRYSE